MANKTDKFGFDDIVDDLESVALAQDKPTKQNRSIPALDATNKKSGPINHVESAKKRAVDAERELADAKKNFENEISKLSKEKSKVLLEMPITKNMVYCTRQFINPSLIDVSIVNERNQELLDEVSLSDLLPKIEESGQRHPGLVRQKADGRFELIYGSRRKKCAEILGRDYLTLVGDIPDADISHLSDEENEYSKPGVYEKAKNYERLIEEKVFKNWSRLALSKGESQSNISRLNAIAKLDIKFVKMFIRPSDMPITFAENINKLLQEDKKTVMKKVEELVELRNKETEKYNEKYNANAILSEIKKSIKNAKKTTLKKPNVKKPVSYFSEDKKLEIKHSITNIGSTKLELKGCDKAQVENVIQYLKKQLNVK